MTLATALAAAAPQVHEPRTYEGGTSCSCGKDQWPHPLPSTFAKARRAVDHGEREWFERRLTGFGGSDAAAALGISRWQTTRSLVEEKGRMIIPDPDSPERLRFRYGRELEPVLREHAWEMIVERHGDMPRPRQSRVLHRAPGLPFVIANVDGFVGDALLELKTDVYGYEPWGDEDGDPRRTVPPMYFVQVQHSLAATNRPRAFLLVNIGLTEDRLYEIPRDDGYIADLVEVETPLWELVVATRARLAGDPFAAIDDLLPPVDGSAASSAWLTKRYPRDDGLILPATAEQEQLVAEFRAARAAVRAAKEREAAAKNRLKDVIGTAAGLSSTLGTITWKRTKDGTETDWQAIADAYRSVIERYLQMLLSGDADTNYLHVADSPLSALVTFETLDAIESLHTGVVEGERRINCPKAWDRPAAA